MPDPLTPAGLDLREFDWMPLEVMRLRDSDLSVLASGDAFRAAVLLWCAAWHQVPAGSLPSDDRLLANLAGYGRDIDGWLGVRNDALRGFVECSDGRLYHPIVCEKAIEADEQRNKQRKRTEAATSARRNGQRNDNRDGPRYDDHLTLPNPTLPKSKKRTAPAEPAGSDGFEELKRIYPKRKGNYGWKAAERKFNSLVKTGVDPKLIIAAATRLADALSSKVGTEFIPMPASWLNSEDFVDLAVTSFEERDDGLIEVLDELQLQAWDTYGRETAGKAYPRNRRGGWRFPTKWPPGHEAKIVSGADHIERGFSPSSI